jgi:hypothetical protein
MVGVNFCASFYSPCQYIQIDQDNAVSF